MSDVSLPKWFMVLVVLLIIAGRAGQGLLLFGGRDDCNGVESVSTAANPVLPSGDLDIKLSGSCDEWGYSSFQWAVSYKQGGAYYPLLSFQSLPMQQSFQIVMCFYKDGYLLESCSERRITYAEKKRTVMLLTGSWVHDAEPDRVEVTCKP